MSLWLRTLLSSAIVSFAATGASMFLLARAVAALVSG
jgi:hypothetical protein